MRVIFRFQDWNAEKNVDGLYASDKEVHQGRSKSITGRFRRSFGTGTERMKRMKRSFNFKSWSSIDGTSKSFGSQRKFLDPQGPFLQRWNKIFVLSCFIAVSLDPLFFYVPVIDDQKKCLGLDNNMVITASVLRSFTDIFYILHIIFQFRTGFIAPSSRVFGRGVLVEDGWLIAKKYLSSYFFIDILAVLPIPQVKPLDRILK